MKKLEDESKENKSMIHNKESTYKFNCTVEIEITGEEEQECEKTEDGKEPVSCKEESSQLKEANVQNEIEANGNIYHLKHIDELDELEMDHADTEENAKYINEDILDISDYEQLLLFEQLFQQLSSCPENEISREEYTKSNRSINSSVFENDIQHPLLEQGPDKDDYVKA